MELEKRVQRFGNSLGVLIGKASAEIAGIKVGDYLKIKVQKNKIIFTKVDKNKGEK